MPLPDEYVPFPLRDPPKAPRRAPETSEEWAVLDTTLENWDRAVRTYAKDPDGQAARAARAARRTNAVPPNPLPTPAAALLGLGMLLRRTINPKDTNKATMYFAWCATILGPDISIAILRNIFGPEILKKALVKQRGRPTVAQAADNCRIHVYADAITMATGERIPLACQRLARMGLQVRTPAGEWKGVTGETVRKRYMQEAGDEFMTIDTFRLLQTWHRAGEPGFLDWLKDLIAQDSSGP
jgi:hypothetical protein